MGRRLQFDIEVSDLDRDKMRIPNRDLIRTPHIDVTEVAEFKLKLRNIFNPQLIKTVRRSRALASFLFKT